MLATSWLGGFGQWLGCVTCQVRRLLNPAWRIVTHNVLHFHSFLPAHLRYGCVSVFDYDDGIDWSLVWDNEVPETLDSPATLANNIGVAMASSETIKKCLGMNLDTLYASVSLDDVPSESKLRARLDGLRAYFSEKCGDNSSVLLPDAWRIFSMPVYLSFKHDVPCLKIEDWLLVRFPHNKGRTVCTIAVYSRPFWAKNMDYVIEEIQLFCGWFFNSIDVAVRVSRADICGDFQGLEDMLTWSNLDVARMAVTRGKYKAANADESSDDASCEAYGTGFRVGKGDVMLRVYDKLVEMKRHHKEDYYSSRWQANGYEGGNIQRVEFQLRREFFKEWLIPETGQRCDTIQDLRDMLSSMWVYLTHQWVRFVDTSSATRKRRCKTLALWEFVQASYSYVEVIPQGVRVHKPRQQRIEAYDDQMWGLFKKRMALKDGSACPDPAYYHASLSEWIEEMEQRKRESVFAGVRRAWHEINAA